MLFALFLACTDSDDSNHGGMCTEIGCIDGLSVNFTPALTGKGTYTFDVTVDGTAYSCDATIPLAGSSTVCGKDNVVSIYLSGTELDPSEQSLPGMHVEGTPKSVQIQVHRDKTLVADADLSPKYQETQPNGPNCPPTCHSASENVATN
jgi:hypothetical protein